jgi:hypothetical protein
MVVSDTSFQPIIRFSERGGCSSPCINDAQQVVGGPRHIGAMIPLLFLILATLLAGPIGFILAAVFLLVWLVVTGSLHVALELLLLPFRAIGWLARR